MQNGVLVVSTSPGGACCEAVRAFLSPMERRVRAVEAKLTEADGVVFASELWTVDPWTHKGSELPDIWPLAKWKEGD